MFTTPQSSVDRTGRQRHRASPAAAGRAVPSASRQPNFLSGGTGGGLRDSDRLVAENQVPRGHATVREYIDLCRRCALDPSQPNRTCRCPCVYNGQPQNASSGQNAEQAAQQSGPEQPSQYDARYRPYYYMYGEFQNQQLTAELVSHERSWNAYDIGQRRPQAEYRWPSGEPQLDPNDLEDLDEENE